MIFQSTCNKKQTEGHKFDPNIFEILEDPQSEYYYYGRDSYEDKGYNYGSYEYPEYKIEYQCQVISINLKGAALKKVETKNNPNINFNDVKAKIQQNKIAVTKNLALSTKQNQCMKVRGLLTGS